MNLVDNSKVYFFHKGCPCSSVSSVEVRSYLPLQMQQISKQNMQILFQFYNLYFNAEHYVMKEYGIGKITGGVTILEI